ncbi:hypothetical protein EZS27_016053 [termite gut metagenome]|uniref:Uncharacterized protein n=1 Tax=termite gut metagenome TaxID=433724 RepID=A0A5J4RQ19_9ZZZZ
MLKIIEGFIKKIPRGYYFDTHTVIDYLIQEYHGIYLKEYHEISKNDNYTVNLYHGHIGQLIQQNFTDILVTNNILVKQVGDSWSKNVKNNFSQNTCWQKL